MALAIFKWADNALIMTVGDNWIIKERPFELSREDILWRLGWESVQLWWISGTTHTNFTDARRLFFYGYLWIFLGEHANTNRDCSVHSYNVLLREARIPNPEVIGCRKKKVTSLLKEDAVPGMARLSPSLFSTPLPLSPPPFLIRSFLIWLGKFSEHIFQLASNIFSNLSH